MAHTLSNAVDEQVSDVMRVDALEAAMRTLCRPSLSIDFGATVRTRDMGIYGMSLQTASTIGEALTRSVRFQPLMTTAAHVLLDRGPSALSWIWSSAESRTLGVRVRNEIVLTEHVAVVRALSPGATPRRVSFMHAAPSDITAHTRYFRCSIVWSADVGADRKLSRWLRFGSAPTGRACLGPVSPAPQASRSCARTTRQPNRRTRERVRSGGGFAGTATALAGRLACVCRER